MPGIYRPWAAGEIITAEKLNDKEEFILTTPADQTVTNSVALVDVAGMQWEAAPNATYRMEVWFVYSGTGATSGGRDIVFACVGPAGVDIARKNIAYDDTVEAGVTGVGRGREILLRQRGAGTGQDVGATGTGNFNAYYEFVRVITSSTGGTIKYQFAQAVAAASTSATVRGGSVMSVKRMA